MSRLSFFAVVLLSFARSAASAAEAPDALAAAHEQVRAGCQAAPPSCGELTAIDAGYRAELDKLKGCASAAKECTPEIVLSTFRAAEALDRRESALPDAARSTGTKRPLLSMSLLLSKTAVLGLATVDPGNAIEVFEKTSAYAPKDVDAVCAGQSNSTTCLEAHSALTDAQLLDKFVRDCEEGSCSFESLEETAETAESATKHYERAAKGTKDSLVTLFSFIKYGEDRLALLVSKDLQRKTDELDAGVAALSSRLNALPRARDRSAALAQYEALAETYRKASLDSDRVASYGYGDNASFREKVNTAATQLADARAKLAARSADATARGLMPYATDDGAVPATASLRRALAPAKLVPVATKVMGGNAPGLDRRMIPAPPPHAPAAAPPIIPGDPSALALAENLFSDDSLKRADARRRAGLSYTVGDPSGRAHLVHTQQYTDSCGIVSQQEVLTYLGLVSGDDPLATEKALAAEAQSRGFFRDGTPTAYSADLLVERRVLVKKEVNAPLELLDAAVRRGGMIIASVDARYLWNQATPGVLAHSIVITGAEVDHSDGKTVGYYLNDSGKDPPERGQFIPIDTFRKAWEGASKDYAEVR